MLRLVHRVTPPDSLQNSPVRQNAIGIVRQERHQIELLGRESDLFIAAKDPMAIVVNRQVANAETSARSVVVDKYSPQGHTNPRDQFIGTKRLGDVVVRTELEGFDLFAFA